MGPLTRIQIFTELAEFRSAAKLSKHDVSFSKLSRAHILSQSSVLWHLWIHWLMLGYALRRRDGQEIFGQIIRLLVTVPGHLFGRVPKGNIGWATVRLTEEFPIPDDLKNLLK